ncbi:MAG: hypothetical protein KBI47_03350 [Armatimonadetes bacterium]|jgi:hypothetical protein|nr:hypothetical protein [Armatimonadota bacterium]MDI9586933.1 C4-type zinc ribbon domain-containing protein [Acidobacteriota bacterium]
MAQELDILFELQQVDSGLALRRQTLAGLDDGTEAENRLRQAKKRLALLDRKRQEIETTYRDKDLQLKGAEEERAARSKQAYGGTVTDPKQLRALQQKIAELERTKGRLEEEMLVLLEEGEEAQKAVDAQREAARALLKQLNELRERSSGQTERLRAEIEQLEARREELAAQVSESMLKQYEQLREKLGGVAVSAVKEGSCSQCHLSVPSTYAPRLRAREQVVKCENCRRILYLPEGESPFVPGEDT